MLILGVCDSDWELSFCELLEDDPGVHTYVRNDGLGFESAIHLSKTSAHEPDFYSLS